MGGFLVVRTEHMDHRELVQCCMYACQKYCTTMAYAFRSYFGITDCAPRSDDCRRVAKPRRPKRREVVDCMRQTHGVEGL